MLHLEMAIKINQTCTVLNLQQKRFWIDLLTNNGHTAVCTTQIDALKPQNP